MNRALYLLISDPDNKELYDTVMSIGNLMNKKLVDKNIYFFSSLANTYFKYKKLDLNSEFKNIANLKENNINYILNDFHGNRDFYFFVRDTMNDFIEQNKNINEENLSIESTKIGLKNLERNFGGLPQEILDKIKQIYYEELPSNKLDKNICYYEYNPISFIDENLKSSNNNSRYLMLLNNSPINDFLITSILKYLDNKNYYHFLKGSPFLSDMEETEGNYYKKNFMKIFEKLTNDNNNIIIMKDLESIYPTLFNLFDKNFIKLKDKGIYSNPDLLFEINPDLKIIILSNYNKLTKENLPFINRFEKHLVTINNLLKKEYIVIAEEIWKKINLIISFNNNKKLKVNLKDILIIKSYEEIAGLLYKIINSENENITKDKIEEEIFKIIVPTFSQDLIVSIKYSGFEKKYKKLSEYIYQIYKEKYRYNFIEFLSKISNNNKFIIYTFSEIRSLCNIINKIIDNKNL